MAIVGRHIFRVAGDGVAVHDVDGGTVRTFPVTRPDGILGIGDAAWIASEGRTRLSWHDATGRVLGACELPRSGAGAGAGAGGPVVYTADRAVRASAVVQGVSGGDAVWIRGGAAAKIAPSGAAIVPAGDALIARSGRRLVVRRDGRELPLQLPAGLDGAACVSGAALDGGGRAGL